MGAGINIFVQDTAKIIVTQAIYRSNVVKPNVTNSHINYEIQIENGVNMMICPMFLNLTRIVIRITL